MKLDIDGIQAFVAIARLGSFQKAADSLQLTQTALTRRIQRLEGYLQVVLLERTTRSVSLTTVGKEFLPQATKLVEELTWSVDRLKGISRSASGDVTIACLAQLAYQWLPSVLVSYARKFPHNRVCILDRHGLQVAEAVKQRAAEFGVNVLMAKDPELTQHAMLEDPYVLFCLNTHAASKLKKATWRELRGLDLITLGESSWHRLQVNYQLVRKDVNVRARFEVENLSTALGLVSAGLGAAVLPASTLLSKAYPNIRQVPLTKPVVKRAIGLIKRRAASLSPAAQALYDILASELGALHAKG